MWCGLCTVKLRSRLLFGRKNTDGEGFLFRILRYQPFPSKQISKLLYHTTLTEEDNIGTLNKCLIANKTFHASLTEQLQLTETQRCNLWQLRLKYNHHAYRHNLTIQLHFLVLQLTPPQGYLDWV